MQCYAWLFPCLRMQVPLQWVQLDLSKGQASIQPLALTPYQTWLFPGAGMADAEAHCPEQPLMTEGQKHCAKGKRAPLVFAQA